MLTELPALGFAEIRDGGVLRCEHLPRVVATTERLHAILRKLLVRELDKHVPDKVVTDVVAYIELLNDSELAELLVDLLVEVLKVLVRLLREFLGDLLAYAPLTKHRTKRSYLQPLPVRSAGSRTCAGSQPSR